MPCHAGVGPVTLWRYNIAPPSLEITVTSTLKNLESAALGTVAPWTEFSALLKWNKDGLMPAIAQQYDTGQVLMLAWMNLDALEETLETGRVCYWSRSRSRFWRKGEESGQVQILKEVRLDCDGDTLLLLVDQTGPACHTGRENCFFYKLSPETVEIISDPLIDPKQLYRNKV